MYMNEQYEQILRDSDISENDKYYWGYQFRLAADVLVPYLQQHGAFTPGNAVAEIGCAEGGVLSAFEIAGAVQTLGTDIASWRLETGRTINSKLGLQAVLTDHDIIGQEPLPQWKHAYDLVILRDVIEHLDDTQAALKHITHILKPGGKLFVTFPPYHSPYGGHQHLIKNFWGRLPYLHLLPRPLFFRLIADGKEIDVHEVQRLHAIRLTANAFMQAARTTGYTLSHEEYYMLRPVFKMKFGLPTIPITPLKSLPFVKQLLSLEAAYILQWK